MAAGFALGVGLVAGVTLAALLVLGLYRTAWAAGGLLVDLVDGAARAGESVRRRARRVRQWVRRRRARGLF
jgi:hypothetical protein